MFAKPNSIMTRKGTVISHPFDSQKSVFVLLWCLVLRQVMQITCLPLAHHNSLRAIFSNGV